MTFDHYHSVVNKEKGLLRKLSIDSERFFSSVDYENPELLVSFLKEREIVFDKIKQIEEERNSGIYLSIKTSQEFDQIHSEIKDILNKMSENDEKFFVEIAKVKLKKIKGMSQLTENNGRRYVGMEQTRPPIVDITQK